MTTPHRVLQLRLVVEAADFDEALTFYRDAVAIAQRPPRRPGRPAAHPVPGAGRGGATVPGVKLLRRALFALSVAAGIAGVMRIRGRGGTPPQHGGWQPIDVPEK